MILLIVSKIISVEETQKVNIIVQEDLKLNLNDLMNEYRFNGLYTNKVDAIQRYVSIYLMFNWNGIEKVLLECIKWHKFVWTIKKLNVLLNLHSNN